MSEVRIAAEPRTEFGKGGARRTRRAGKIPAVLYGHGQAPRHIALPAREFTNAIKHGANTLLTIEIEGGVRWERLTPSTLDGADVIELGWLLGAEELRITPVVPVGAASRHEGWSVDRAEIRRVAAAAPGREGYRLFVLSGTADQVAYLGERAPGTFLVRPSGAVASPTASVEGVLGRLETLGEQNLDGIRGPLDLERQVLALGRREVAQDVVGGVVAVRGGGEDRAEQQPVAAPGDEVVQPAQQPRQPVHLAGDLAELLLGPDEAERVHLPPDHVVHPGRHLHLQDRRPAHCRLDRPPCQTDAAGGGGTSAPQPPRLVADVPDIKVIVTNA